MHKAFNVVHILEAILAPIYCLNMKKWQRSCGQGNQPSCGLPIALGFVIWNIWHNKPASRSTSAYSDRLKIIMQSLELLLMQLLLCHATLPCHLYRQQSMLSCPSARHAYQLTVSIACMLPSSATSWQLYLVLQLRLEV